MATDVEQLQAELVALRQENAQLRDEAMAATLPLAGTDPAPEAKRSRRGWWRGLLSAICIVLVGILVPLSVVGGWARTQLVSEEAFVSTFAPLADDPDVQALIIDEATTAINESLDVGAFTNDLFDGLATLDLPPRALAALDLLREPAASGVETLIDRGVTRVVESDAFSTVWSTALVASHRALVATATAGDSTGAVTLSDDGTLGIELAPIIEELKTRMIDQGIGIASMIPVIDKTIVLLQSDALLLVGTVYTLAVTVGLWLPFVALGLVALGIALARRRSVAVLGSGIAIAIGAGLLAFALNIAGVIAGLNAPALGIPADTIDTILYAVVGAMRDTAVVLTFLGIVVAISGWLGGRSSSAARVRAVTGSLSTRARRSLRGSGLNTGPFGEWLYAQRVLVRVIILVLAIALLFALRPLSIGEIVLTVVIALLVWLALALLERHPGDEVAVEASRDGADDLAADAEPSEVIVIDEEPEAVLVVSSASDAGETDETTDAATDAAAASKKKPRA